jgi:hypothetical protein
VSASTGAGRAPGDRHLEARGEELAPELEVPPREARIGADDRLPEVADVPPGPERRLRFLLQVRAGREGRAERPTPSAGATRAGPSALG